MQHTVAIQKNCKIFKVVKSIREFIYYDLNFLVPWDSPGILPESDPLLSSERSKEPSSVPKLI